MGKIERTPVANTDALHWLSFLPRYSPTGQARCHNTSTQLCSLFILIYSIRDESKKLHLLMISILTSSPISHRPSPIAQSYTRLTSRTSLSILQGCTMLHHLMVGTWTPPGAIFTFEFDDEKLTLKLIKRTAIPENEPISWMTFDVSSAVRFRAPS